MQSASSRKALALFMPVGIFALGAGFAACGGSSSNTGGSPTTPSNDSGTPNSGAISDAGAGTDAVGMVGKGPGSCANPTVTIDFAPMYSAFIPGSTAHSFVIPAITDDGKTATWSVSDPTQAQLTGEDFSGSPGALITVTGVGTGSDGTKGSLGQITVYATESDGTCGASVLNVTASTEADWQIGNTRYNNDVVLTRTNPGMPTRLADGGFSFGQTLAASDGGSIYERDGGTACTNCHGPTANSPNSPYHNVSHTPEQTGGFSDDELVQIFTQGIIPDGGYFDPSVINANCDGGGAPVALPDGGTTTCTAVAQETWHAFHQWADITSDQYAGIVVYLRSLAPLAQTGAANFGRGARPMRDGGGGFNRGDGGGFQFNFDGSFPGFDGSFPFMNPTNGPDATVPPTPDAGSTTVPDTGSTTVPDTGSTTVPDTGSTTVTVPDAGSADAETE